MKYPEHEKLNKVQDQSQWLGEFLDWLQSNGRVIGEWKEIEEFGNYHKLLPVSLNINQLLAEYFDIDLVKIDKEKRQMLKDLRAMNQN